MAESENAVATDRHAIVSTPGRRTRSLIFNIMLGAAGGAFCSWYIYDTVWQWPLPFMTAAFVLGLRVDIWRAQRGAQT